MKFSFIHENCTAWPVRVMCAVLGISVSGYYAWRSRAESKRATANRHLLGRIQGIHADSSGTYGSPRIHAVLRRAGQPVGRSRVETLMRRAGLRGIAALPRRTRTTDSRHNYPIAPNRLARNFTAQRPNQVWLADLTHIPPDKVGSTLRRSSTCAPGRSLAGRKGILGAIRCTRKLHRKL